MNDRLSHRFLAVFAMMMLNYAPMQAQIQAPDLLCIDNDTLVWETPVNSCGPFQGYIIYGSQNADGLFSPIDTVRDEAQTRYFHEDVGGVTWYYYLESDYNCPGLNRLTSDTLDNRIPEVGPLQSVSVRGREAILTWAPSPSPETIGYIISRNTSAGTTIIDTVYDATTYIDVDAAANMRVETYFVTAIDQCGNTSLVDTPHSTMLLSNGEVSACDQSISISWTPYEGWENGVERYEVLVELDSGSNNQMIDGTTAGNITNYTFFNADQGEIYCFTIRAVQADGDNTAVSNIICDVADVVQPIRELTITNASFNTTGGIAVSWRWNEDAQLTQAALLRSADNGPFIPIHNIDINNLTTENTFTDTDFPADAQQLCYRVETTDLCGDTAESNVGCTINATAVTDGQGGNRVTWTPFDLGQTTSLEYELFRVQGGTATSIATLSGTDTEFIDQVDLSNEVSGTICYYVVASATLTLPGGRTADVVTRSNTACTEQSSKVYIPNAFAPTGLNTEFRAYLQFGNPAEYLLEIYDRWGNKVFAAQSPDQGWDGTKDGRDLPAGVYIYRLVIRQSNGGMIERSGSVALIR